MLFEEGKKHKTLDLELYLLYKTHVKTFLKSIRDITKIGGKILVGIFFLPYVFLCFSTFLQ